MGRVQREKRVAPERGRDPQHRVRRGPGAPLAACFGPGRMQISPKSVAGEGMRGRGVRLVGLQLPADLQDDKPGPPENIRHLPDASARARGNH